MTDRWRSCPSSSLSTLCPLSRLPSDGIIVVDPDGCWLDFMEAESLTFFPEDSSRPRRSHDIRPMGGGGGLDERFDTGSSLAAAVASD